MRNTSVYRAFLSHPHKVRRPGYESRFVLGSLFIVPDCIIATHPLLSPARWKVFSVDLKSRHIAQDTLLVKTVHYVALVNVLLP